MTGDLSIEKIIMRDKFILIDTCAVIQPFGQSNRDLESKIDSLGFWRKKLLENLNSFYFTPGVFSEIKRGENFFRRSLSLDRFLFYKSEADSLLEIIQDLFLIDFDSFEKRRYNSLKKEYSLYHPKALSKIDYNLIISSLVLYEREKNGALISNDILLSNKFYKIKKVSKKNNLSFYFRNKFSSFREGPLPRHRKRRV